MGPCLPKVVFCIDLSSYEHLLKGISCIRKLMQSFPAVNRTMNDNWTIRTNLSSFACVLPVYLMHICMSEMPKIVNELTVLTFDVKSGHSNNISFKHLFTLEKIMTGNLNLAFIITHSWENWAKNTISIRWIKHSHFISNVRSFRKIEFGLNWPK